MIKCFILPWLKVQDFNNPELSNLKTCCMPTKCLNDQLPKYKTENKSEKLIKICLIQHFETDFLWKVSLKILNSGIILKTFTHVFHCPT